MADLTCLFLRQFVPLIRPQRLPNNLPPATVLESSWSTDQGQNAPQWRAFPGGLTHPKGRNEEENEKRLRKIRKIERILRKK